MSGVSTRWKKLFLRSLLWSAEENGSSLLAALKTAAKAKLEAAGDGTTLIGSSANGASVTYAIPAGGPGPSGMVEIVAELMERYDAAVAALPDSAEDDQIASHMLARMTPVRHVGARFRGLAK